MQKDLNDNTITSTDSHDEDAAYTRKNLTVWMRFHWLRADYGTPEGNLIPPNKLAIKWLLKLHAIVEYTQLKYF